MWAWTAAKKILTIYLNYKHFRNISLNAYQSSTMSFFIMFWKEPNWCLRFTHSCVLPQRGFSSPESTGSDSITCKTMSVATFDLTSNMLDDTYKRYKLSSNIPPTFYPKCWIDWTRPLISNFMTSQPGSQRQIITIQILPNISQSKDNQTMKFGQVIEYNEKYCSSKVMQKMKQGD